MNQYFSQFFLIIMCIFSLAGGQVLTQSLSEEDIANIAYLSDWTESGLAMLVEGEYREAAAPGSATQIVVKLTDKRAVGELDGHEAAVVVLVTDPGGSGTFYDLALLVQEEDAWMNSDTLLLGDRVKIHDLSIKNNEILVEMDTHGPDDDMCCPSQRSVQKFSVKNDRFVTPPDPILLDVVWKWRQTVSNDGSEMIPPTPEKYTLQFLEDGTLAIQADCNQVGGGAFSKCCKLTPFLCSS